MLAHLLPFRRARRRAAKGTAAIEFAMTMPVLCLLFLGTYDVARMLTGVEDARRAAIAGANAASCNSTLTNTLLTSIMKAMVANSPARVWTDTANTGLIMTVFSTDQNGKVSLTTQAKYPTTLAQVSVFGCKAGSTPAMAQNVSWEAGDLFIIGEVFYKFQPFVLSGRLIPNQDLLTFHDYIAFRPRQPTQVGDLVNKPASPAAGTC